MWTVDQRNNGKEFVSIVRVDALTAVPTLTFQDGKAKQDNGDG